MTLQLSQDYNRIEKAIHYLAQHTQEQPSLGQVAKAVGMSEFHFQRTFQRWAGVSPKKFLQFITKEYVKSLLDQSSVLEASFEAGLSSPSRLHDLLISCEAMSPGEYKQKGQGLVIDYGFHPTLFGECFIAVTSRGICQLEFMDGRTQASVLKVFRNRWVNARIIENQLGAKKYIERIFGTDQKGKIQLLCRGTNFQIKVWEALLKIPTNKVVSYKTIAHLVGSPKAVRAVGTAVGQNPIAYLIPCHRVIRETGALGGYRWGLNRKRSILAMEAVKN